MGTSTRRMRSLYQLLAIGLSSGNLKNEWGNNLSGVLVENCREDSLVARGGSWRGSPEVVKQRLGTSVLLGG
jgi:hypothetical protein